MTQLDRQDQDDYSGQCSACGSEVYTDELLGEREHLVAGQLLCGACWVEHTEQMQDWSSDMDWRQSE